MIPTVGFNMRKVTKGNVTIKVSLKAFVKVIFIISLFMTTFRASKIADPAKSVSGPFS